MDNRRIVLSVEGRERYLNALREQGRAESTLQTYERSLRKEKGDAFDGHSH